jgi:tetratricopeptide (TPR) repeat protein
MSYKDSFKDNFDEGIKASKIGEYSEAKNFFFKCLNTKDIDLYYYKARYNYGIMCLKLGKYEEAIESFDELTRNKCEEKTETKHKYFLSWHNKIFAYRKLWRLNDAENGLNEAIEKTNYNYKGSNEHYYSNASLLYHRGLLYSEISELQKS